MSVKFLRRGAIAGVILLSSASWAVLPAVGAPLEGEPPAAIQHTAPTTPAPESEAAAPETPPRTEEPSAPPAPEAVAEADDSGEPAPEIVVTVPEFSLAGPAIAEVEVTVANGSDAAMKSVSVAFQGPVGWQVAPHAQEIDSIKPGRAGSATFQIRIPEARAGFALRVFTATVSYSGGDGAGSATATRAIPTAPPLAELALAFNNVGITDESQPTAGNLDGYGNTFSAQQLAAAGAGPGAEI